MTEARHHCDAIVSFPLPPVTVICCPFLPLFVPKQKRQPISDFNCVSLRCLIHSTTASCLSEVSPCLHRLRADLLPLESVLLTLHPRRSKTDVDSGRGFEIFGYKAVVVDRFESHTLPLVYCRQLSPTRPHTDQQRGSDMLHLPIC